MPKLTTNKASFLRALQIASKAINPKPIIPLYSNILLDVDGETVKMTATNSEISIRVNVEDAKGGKFRTAVPAKLTTDFVNMLQDEKLSIKFEENTQSIFIQTEHSQNTIKCVNADDYPEAPMIEKALLKVNALDLKKAVVKTSFCASTDNNRPVLQGIQMIVDNSKLVFLTTDGFRMSREEIVIPKKYIKEKAKAIISAYSFDIVSKILDDEGDISIEIQDTKVIFNSSNICISVQKTDGNFPDINAIIASVAKTNTVIVLPTIQLLRTCKQVELFAGSTNTAKLTVDGIASIELSAISQEKGDSNAKINASSVKGKSITVGINIQFLKQFLGICDTEEVVFEFIDPTKPILLTMKENTTFKHIIMPIVLQKTSK